MPAREELEAAGVHFPTKDELKEIVALLNSKLDKIVPKEDPGTWFSFFKAFDEEYGSGTRARPPLAIGSTPESPPVPRPADSICSNLVQRLWHA